MSVKVDPTTGKATLSLQLLIRNNTEAELEKLNPVLSKGEPAYAHDTGVFAVGDGVSTWSQLVQNPDSITSSVSALRLKYKRTINGLEFDGTSNISNYGVCPTDGNTRVKTVSIDNFVLSHGALAIVTFLYTNVAANPVLSINECAAQAIKFNGNTVTSGFFEANQTYLFVYVIEDAQTNTGSFYFIGNHNEVEGNAISVTSEGKIRSNLTLDYDSNDKKINLYADSSVISAIDVSELVKDSFLQSVEVIENTKLKFTWNTIMFDSDNNMVADTNVTVVDIADIIDEYQISADQVIFTEDLTYTADIGVKKLDGAPKGTIEANNKSLTQVLKSILAERKQPSTSSMVPSCTFNVTSINYATNTVGIGYSALDKRTTSTDNTEIGNYITGAVVKTTFDPGTYEYGYSTSSDGTGKVTIPNSSTGQTATSATITCDKTIKSSTQSGALDSTGRSDTIVFNSNIALNAVGDATVYATFSNSLVYGDSTRYPLDNLGDRATIDNGNTYMQPVAGGTEPLTAYVKPSGVHRSCFYYVGSDTTTTLNSAFLRNYGVSTRSGYSKSVFGTVTIPKGAKRVVFAVPGTYTKLSCIDVDGNGFQIGTVAGTDSKFTPSTFNVTGANGLSGTSYSVFTFVNTNGVQATRFTVEITA